MDNQAEIFKIILDNAESYIFTKDLNGCYTYANKKLCELFERSISDILGHDDSQFFSLEQSKDLSENDRLVMLKGEIVTHNEYNVIAKTGETRCYRCEKQPLRNSMGKIIGMFGIAFDITEHKEIEEKLLFMAHYDSLTKLPNRIILNDRFKQAVAHSNRNETLIAICFLDLDNFKPINDNYGHATGDKIIIEVANRLNATIREEDTASRVGGDEFTLLLANIESLEQCEQLLDRLQNALELPYVIDECTHIISVSIGVTVYPTDNHDFDTLVRHADQAMYQSKQNGMNKFRFFRTINRARFRV